MKTRGRNICDTLKAIRKEIADANGIEYSPEECHFKGECRGTCPKCEQEVKDLEYELRLRQMAGTAIKGGRRRCWNSCHDCMLEQQDTKNGFG